ncbi:MAG: ribonuclease HII [Lentimonas sp.]|jgi:ribonuclease HII
MIIATKIKPHFLKPDFSIENEVIYEKSNPNSVIVGIDEAGRGPLSGPVVAAAIILNRNNYPDDLNDSKKLSNKKRGEIFSKLKDVAKFGIGIVNEKTIDKINILNATKLAMQYAFKDLSEKHNINIDFAIIDGNFVPELQCSSRSIIKGDQKSLSIAAASIIAKETRDSIMCKLDQELPEYGWKENKGYPTAKHYEMIKEYGISKYHRQSFRLK